MNKVFTPRNTFPRCNQDLSCDLVLSLVPIIILLHATPAILSFLFTSLTFCVISKPYKYTLVRKSPLILFVASDICLVIFCHLRQRRMPFLQR